ncbi:hypothetical protein BJ170DRAFT_682069 [Xylariales sp. AK1849]|nr:hypothetical protein BJ170DRAFT_682069 [Xylariales sp. AK1849]
MAPLRSIAAATLLFLGASHAHFLLNSPAPVGAFDDDTEGNAPCGGLTPDFSNKAQTQTNFSVGGNAIATLSTHPQTNFLYRITTDASASGNWTQIYPIFQQTGEGAFCAPMVTVPESFIGQTGVLSVVADGPDGLLYQCATVNFISGMNMTKPSSCSNASSVTAAFAADSTLSAVLDSTASSTPSSTTTPNVAGPNYGSLEGLRSLLTVGCMMAMGAAFLM